MSGRKVVVSKLSLGWEVIEARNFTCRRSQLRPPCTCIGRQYLGTLLIYVSNVGELKFMVRPSSVHFCDFHFFAIVTPHLS